MLIAAYDGEAEEMEAIDNGTGTYLCTVTQDPVGMSETIAQQVEDYIFNGATYEQFQSAPAGVYGEDGQLAADLSIGWYRQWKKAPPGSLFPYQVSQ